MVHWHGVEPFHVEFGAQKMGEFQMKFQILRLFGLLMIWILLLFFAIGFLWHFDKISLTHTEKLLMVIGMMICIFGSSICLSIKEAD